MSLPGGNQSPYRAPCDGWVLCGSGPRYQHALASEKNLNVWMSNAVVPDYTTEDAYRAPYERPVAYNECTDGSCDGSDICPDPTSEYPPCLGWIGVLQNSDDDYCQYLYTESAPNPVPVSWYQPQMVTGITIDNPGSGYEAGQNFSIAGGTTSGYIGPLSATANGTITSVNEDGGITGVKLLDGGSYSVNPPSPNSITTAVHGADATLNLTFGNQTEDISQCFKYGYKNVQAMRQWHGVFGFFGSAGGGALYYCTTENETYDEDQTCFNLYTPYNNSAPQSKYTTCSGATSYSETDYTNSEGDTTTYTETYDMTVSVDPMTGLLTMSGSLTGAPADTNSALAYFNQIILTAAGSWFNNTAYAPYTYIQEAQGEEPSYPGSFYLGTAPPFNCDQFAQYTNEDDETVTYKVLEIGDGTWTVYGLTYDGDGNVTGTTEVFTGTFAISDSAASFSFTCEDESLGTYTNTLTITDSELSYSWYFAPYDPPVMEFSMVSQTLTCTLTYSGANTSSGIQADLVTLLNEWDLTDDAQYPWRTDGYTSIAPLVVRNEYPGNRTIAFADAPTDNSYVDPFTGQYDSTIIGAPVPAGYQGIFDFDYTDYQVCETDDPPGLYVYGYGLPNTGQYGLPLTATHWTNLSYAVQFGPGAWIFYGLNPSWQNCGTPPDNFTYSPGLIAVAQKWAETKMGFPSQNFDRPGGDDRFVYDENVVYSICGTSNMGEGPGGNNQGGKISLQLTASCGEVVISDSSGLWGGPAVGGFYEIASVTAATGLSCADACVVTLGSLIYNVPDNWASASGDDDNCFGKLRWSTGNPATDPPPILGRAGISAIAEYDSMPDVTELTTDSLPDLGLILSGHDSVDIYNSAMGLISGNLSVTRIDDTHFTVPVAVGTLAGAAWIQSHGSNAYYWDDQFPKGDYAYTTFTWWPRLLCEAGRINAIAADCSGDSCSGSDCPSTETVYTYPFSAFSQEAGCVPFSPCSPSVLCISPNGESFPNGATYDFATIDFDEQYGSGWQGEIQQVMEDLFYQTPHYPAQGADCTADPFAWSADNGTCETSTDTQVFYAHPPMVECRLTVPDGAPALPGSITIGFNSPVDIVSGDEVPANTLLPSAENGLNEGGDAGIGLNTPTIWELWSAECDCISGGGDFAATYQNQVYGCPS